MQGSHLKLTVDGNILAVENLIFSHSLGNSVGSFEADLHPKEFRFLKNRMGKQVEIVVGDFKRYCLLEQLSWEPRKGLSIAGRDLISIMLDSTAKPKSYSDGVMFSSIASSICNDFGFRFEATKNKELKECVVNKGESYLAFLERFAKPWILTTQTGKDLKVLDSSSKIPIKEGFKLTGLEYSYDITDVFESYEAIDGSHSWMPGWKKSKQRKVSGSGPKGKKKLFFSDKKDLASEAQTRESDALNVNFTVDRPFIVSPGTTLDIDTLEIQGQYKVKSINLEISPKDISTQVTATR